MKTDRTSPPPRARGNAIRVSTRCVTAAVLVMLCPSRALAQSAGADPAGGTGASPPSDTAPSSDTTRPAETAPPQSATPPAAGSSTAPGSSATPGATDSASPAPGSTTAPGATPEVDPLLAEDTTPQIRQGVTGRVTDARSGESMMDAAVQVVGRSRRYTADIDGNFAIELPPGTYTLRSYYPQYRAVRLENVTVRRNEVTRLDIHLEPVTPNRPVGQVVVVTARADTSTAATVLEMRRQSASVSDVISAQEIARSPDTTASDSVRRVVGTSIVDGQYAYVRGLGGRYVNTLLNGVPLPPTDPDIPGVQLDVFPSALLNGMSLIKTFTPDMPGDFAGGSLNISTRDFPTRLTLNVNVSLGLDSFTHNGAGALRGHGGSLDFLGIDDGSRALPSTFPNRLVSTRVTNGATLDEVTAAGRSLPNHWNIARQTPSPNLGIGFTIGNTTRIANRPFGYLLTFGYSNNLRRSLDTLRAVRNAGTPEAPVWEARQTLRQESTTENVLFGLLGTANYQPAPNNEVGITALLTRSTSNFAGERSGYDETMASDARWQQLRFIERSMGFLQVTGDHREIGRAVRVRWQLFGSTSTRNEPDLRQLTFQRSPAGYAIAPGIGNLARIWDSLTQIEGGAALDVGFPIGRVIQARVGGLVRFADRSFNLRRFTYDDNGVQPELTLRPAEEFFAPANLGPELEFREITDSRDSYRAIQQQYAPFVRADLALGPSFRVTAGARLEVFRQWVSSQSPFAGQGAGTGTVPTRTDRTDINVLPSLALTWAVNPRMNVRATYGGTVARPLIRELAPYNFYDFIRNRNVTGNPRLAASFIHNADVRWEYFPGGNEVIAVSAFYKNFQNPIEQVFADRDGNSVTFANVQGAQNFGAEFEVRMSLGRLSRALSSFQLGGNLALVHSQVAMSAEQQMNATSAQRPLAGQSPFLGNVMMGYAPERGRVQAYVYYNVFGPRIEDVGTGGLSDVYQDTLHQLDAALVFEPVDRFQLRLTARNLLFQPTVLRQAGIAIQETLPITSFALRASWTY